MHRVRGHTLLEVTIALAVLAGVCLGIANMVWTSGRVDSSSRQMTLVMARMESVMAEVSAAGVRNALARYSAPNDGFDVPSLQGVGGKRVGKIVLITDERLVGRDLNGNGTATDRDVRADAVLLPVRLEAEWKDGFGTFQMAVVSYVSTY
jgi:type II secretory pathway component PulJ